MVHVHFVVVSNAQVMVNHFCQDGSTDWGKPYYFLLQLLDDGQKIGWVGQITESFGIRLLDRP